MLVNRRYRQAASGFSWRGIGRLACANEVYGIKVELGPKMQVVEQGADRVASPPNRRTLRRLLAVTRQEPA
jgi:hypothetical protein